MKIWTVDKSQAIVTTWRWCKTTKRNVISTLSGKFPITIWFESTAIQFYEFILWNFHDFFLTISSADLRHQNKNSWLLKQNQKKKLAITIEFREEKPKLVRLFYWFVISSNIIKKYELSVPRHFENDKALATNQPENNISIRRILWKSIFCYK